MEIHEAKHIDDGFTGKLGDMNYILMYAAFR